MPALRSIFAQNRATSALVIEGIGFAILILMTIAHPAGPTNDFNILDAKLRRAFRSIEPKVLYFAYGSGSAIFVRRHPCGRTGTCICSPRTRTSNSWELCFLGPFRGDGRNEFEPRVVVSAAADNERFTVWGPARPYPLALCSDGNESAARVAERSTQHACVPHSRFESGRGPVDTIQSKKARAAEATRAR